MSRENDALLEAAEVLADMVAARVVERLGAPSSTGMQSQTDSPLGPRRHCAAVRRRIRDGEPGAQIVGRSFLLSREALEDELSRATMQRTEQRPPAAVAVADELRQELRLVQEPPRRQAKPSAGRGGR
jgi:hypothetical protein